MTCDRKTFSTVVNMKWLRRRQKKEKRSSGAYAASAQFQPEYLSTTSLQGVSRRKKRKRKSVKRKKEGRKEGKTPTFIRGHIKQRKPDDFLEGKSDLILYSHYFFPSSSSSHYELVHWVWSGLFSLCVAWAFSSDRPTDEDGDIHCLLPLVGGRRKNNGLAQACICVKQERKKGTFSFFPITGHSEEANNRGWVS